MNYYITIYKTSNNMVYPYLDPLSLRNRCILDIHNFISEYNIINDSDCEISIFDKSVKYTQIKNKLNEIISHMQKIKDKNNKTYKITTIDYSHNIYKFSKKNQERLWILRTLLFYQLFIVLYYVCENSSIHKKICKNIKYKKLDNINLYNFGIFGSIKPTSDIDVGIFYNSNDLSNISYLVELIDSIYSNLLNITTLDLDIEVYANMDMIINNDYSILPKQQFYLFYLKTSNFNEKDFKKIVPYSYMSILKNYISGHTEKNKNVNINEIINDFDISLITKYIDKKYIYEDIFDSVKNKIIEREKLSHNEYSKKFYELVKKAEVYKYNVFKNKKKIPKKDIITLYSYIAEYLLYRESGYLCNSTVIHIVKLMQELKYKKYPTITPSYCKNNENPICMIGRYGVIISILEQIGFIIKYSVLYCDTDKNKCKIKLDKYNKRIKNGKSLLNNIKGNNYTIKK